MGVYDDYEDIQLKVGDYCMMHYEIGDEVDIPDGVYIAPDGAVVIEDGKLLMTTENVKNKWGGSVDVSDKNPLVNAVQDLEKDIFAQKLDDYKSIVEQISDYFGDHKALLPGGTLEDIYKAAQKLVEEDKKKIEKKEEEN